MFQDRGPHLVSAVASAWTFSSLRPLTDNVPLPYACVDTLLFGDKNPCAWQPFIDLTYQLRLAPDDTVQAGDDFEFTMTARDGIPGGPARLADLQVWTSGDSGKTWTKAQVVAAKDDIFRVHVRNPDLADGATGSVSIRAVAEDSAGNSLDQTITDAYHVVASSSDQGNGR
jgi:hypothetical protein